MNSTTRHRRHRPLQQVTACAAGAILFGADAVEVGAWAIHTSNGGLLVGALALGITAFVLIVYAGSWTASTGWHNARDHYLTAAAARYSPPPWPWNQPEPEEHTAAADDPEQPDPAVVRLDGHVVDHWRWNGSPPPPAPYDPRPWMPPVSATAAEHAAAAP